MRRRGGPASAMQLLGLGTGRRLGGRAFVARRCRLAIARTGGLVAGAFCAFGFFQFAVAAVFAALGGFAHDDLQKIKSNIRR